MTLDLQWKERLQKRLNKMSKLYQLEYFICGLLKTNALENYCKDNDLLSDYYNEEPEHEDRWMDLD